MSPRPAVCKLRKNSEYEPNHVKTFFFSFCIGENKGTDQLSGYCTSDQNHFRFIDSTRFPFSFYGQDFKPLPSLGCSFFSDLMCNPDYMFSFGAAHIYLYISLPCASGWAFICSHAVIGGIVQHNDTGLVQIGASTPPIF